MVEAVNIGNIIIAEDRARMQIKLMLVTGIIQFIHKYLGEFCIVSNSRLVMEMILECHGLHSRYITTNMVGFVIGTREVSVYFTMR